MALIRKYAGRRRAVRLLWVLVFALALFAILEQHFPASDLMIAAVIAGSFILFLVLGLYIRKAKRVHVSENIKFTFSKEHNGVVEMHLKRTRCDKSAAIFTRLTTAIDEMSDYAKSVGATKMKIESPLLNSISAPRAANRLAKHLNASFQLHPPRALNCIVSALAHRAMHKCECPAPPLLESISAKLSAYGFTLELPL